MARRYYPGLVHGPNAKEEGTSYGIHFPDLPGCMSAGDTLEECLSNAEEAVTLYLEGVVEHGDSIPPSSSLEAARATADPEYVDSLVAIQLVPALLPSNTTRINLTIDEELLRRIDAAAGHYGRSGWIAEAAREKLSAGRVDGLSERSSPFKSAPARGKHPRPKIASRRSGRKDERKSQTRKRK